MDSVINRLRNTVTTVTSTVSQLSVVLPGNPVTREFEVSQHVASGGPGLLWKIYSGFKKSTKQEASIFLFEKKQLDKWNRKEREVMIDILKKGVQQLTKLRHPRILTVQHPLEESRDSLAFATEPIFASLANILGYTDNMPEPLNPVIRNYKLHEIEIKYGLLQVCDGLTFLHRDARMLHGNLCPESIIINEQGSWKIFGLDFSIAAVGNGNEVCVFNCTNMSPISKVKWNCAEYETNANPVSQQHLDYLAPEYTTNLTCSPASDMFSLGLLTYTAFNNGKPFLTSGNNWNAFRQNIKTFNSLSESSLKCIPPEMRAFERLLLSASPDKRPDSHEFSKLEFLHDPCVKTLNYLDSLFQWDNLQKSKFYKGLGEILPKLPHRVRVHRVVPCLSQEFVNPSMVPFVLPNVLKISEWSTNEEFAQHILPFLKDVMKLREPVQILFIFMKYMELLLQKTPPDITKSDVLPLIYGSLESESVQVQELCLSIIPSFAALIDYPAMKNSLLPRIRKLCITTQSLSVRVSCLVCMGKILDHLDKWLVMDFVLPFLTEIPSREPAVIMGILGITKLAATHRKLGVTKELIATRILPFLFPLTVENGLTLQQFTSVMTFIHELIQQVESEQTLKLAEVGAIAREQMKVDMDIRGFGEGSEMKDIFGDMIVTTNGNSNTGSSGSNLGVYNPFGSSGTSTPTDSKSVSPSAMLSPTANRPTMAELGTKRSPNTGTKDLTASLIDSQLNQMKLTGLGALQQVRVPAIPPPVLSPPYQQPPSPFPSMNSMQMQAGGSNSQYFGMGMPSPGANSNSMMMSRPPAPSTFNNVNQNFPSLVPSSVRPSNPVGGSGVKLSQRDIDDFLS